MNKSSAIQKYFWKAGMFVRGARHTRRQSLLPLVLLVMALLVAGCGRSSRAGTPTPLPPLVRPEQPTPFYGVVTTPTATPEPVSSSESIRQQLATKVAEQRLAMATPTPTSALSPAVSVTETPVLMLPTALGIVSGSGATFYKTPGGAVIDILPAGATVTITGKSADGRWLAAYTGEGVPGWIEAGRAHVFGDEDMLVTVTESRGAEIIATLIAEANLPVAPIPVTPNPLPTVLSTLVAPAATPSIQTEDVTGKITGVVNVQSLNVRAGPGTNFPVVAGVRQGQTLTLLARNEAGDWLQIELSTAPEGFGWVFAPLVNVSGDIEQLPVSDQTSRPPGASSSQAQPSTASASGLTGQFVFQDRSGGKIYRYDPRTGELRVLTSGTDPAISPNGRTVAFVRGGGENGLYLIDVDGGNERRIYTGNAPRTPKWSPDGQWIVFSQITGTERCYDVGFGICLPFSPPGRPARLVERSKRNLARVDFNGQNYRDIPSLNSAIAPDWSARGIVYQSSAGLQITEDTPDAKTRVLLNEARFQDPDWQPGGNRIVFQSREGSHWEIFIANDDGGGLAALTSPPLLAAEVPNNAAPAWSPDGRQIVFASDRSGEWGLWVMDANGGNLRQLPVNVPLDYSFQAEQLVDWGP